MSLNETRSIASWQRFGLQAVLLMFVAAYAFILVRTAWLSDDGYISFRVVSNFVNGFGLRWNVAERVQVYTHPLWLFTLAFFHFITREMYYTPLVLSMVLSVATVVLLAFGVASRRENAMLAVLTLTLSCAYMDYSTSGLENPLTHFLIVLFALLYFKADFTPYRCLVLAAMASLAVLNRMDLALVFAPALLYALWQARSWKALILTALAFLPVVGWEAFSLIYYGFPFPNTYYAKLGKGISAWSSAQSGVFFLWDSLRNDPLTLTASAAGLLLALYSKNVARICFAAGAVLYLVYLVKIGGDWMSGRFLDVVLLLGVLQMAALSTAIGRPFWSASIVLILVLGQMAQYPTVLSGENCVDEMGEALQDFANHRVASARVHEYDRTGLLLALRGMAMPNSPARAEGMKLAAANKADLRTITDGGILPFFAGPRIHFVDLWCLVDPLRAHMPCSAATKFAPGHLMRPIPKGYLKTLSSGENRIAAPRLAEYYDHLHLIVSGNLWNPERLKTIVMMNLGFYDALLHAQ